MTGAGRAIRVRGRARISGSRAAATQRASNATLPLARPDLTATSAEPRSSFRRDLAPAPAVPAGERRMGEILAIDHDAGTVSIRLDDGWGSTDREVFDLPLAFLAPSRRSTLTVGEKVVCVVEDQVTAGGRRVLIEVGNPGRLALGPTKAAEADLERPTTASIAEAINSGALRREIDEALGWDPELAV